MTKHYAFISAEREKLATTTSPAGLFFSAMVWLMLPLTAVAFTESSYIVSGGIPEVLVKPIVTGETSVSFELDTDAVNAISLTLYVPAMDPSFILRDGAGVEVTTNASSNVVFTEGVEIDPAFPPPGGVFYLPTLPINGAGLWTLTVTFAPSPEAASVLVEMRAKSDYSVAFTTLTESITVGRPFPLTFMAIQEDAPQPGALATIEVERLDTSTVSIFDAVDDGLGEDAEASDGLYTATLIVDAPDTYRVRGIAEFATSGGPVTRRTAPVQIRAYEPEVSFRGIEAKADTENGCISGISVEVGIDLVSEVSLLFQTELTAPNGGVLSRQSTVELSAGVNRILRTTYAAQELLEGFPEGGPYTVKSVSVYEDLDENLLQVYGNSNVAVIPTITPEEFCRNAIEIGNPLDSPTGEVVEFDYLLRDNLVEKLQIKLYVYVVQGGNYSISFKIDGADQNRSRLLGGNFSLKKGSNTLLFESPYSAYLDDDGPYSVSAVVVVGPAGSIQVSRLGTPLNLARWQFFSEDLRDLNNNGEYDPDDRIGIMDGRGETALSPGDRRDVNRDGMVNVADAYVLAQPLT